MKSKLDKCIMDLHIGSNKDCSWKSMNGPNFFVLTKKKTWKQVLARAPNTVSIAQMVRLLASQSTRMAGS